MKLGPFAWLAVEMGFLALASFGCRDPERETFTAEAGERSAPKSESSSALASHPLPPTSDPRPSASLPAIENLGTSADGGGKHGPEPVGGSWVTCYGNYRPTSTPERDVMRLGILCGPANGMKLVGSMLTGEAGENVTEHLFDARAGECFRVFAVAETSARDLAVVVRDPKGSPIASDHNNDRWPIVNPDGPFCVFDAGKYGVQVHARQGRGKYALQIWRL